MTMALYDWRAVFHEYNAVLVKRSSRYPMTEEILYTRAQTNNTSPRFFDNRAILIPRILGVGHVT